MRLPWRNNEKLIKALYDKVQALEKEIAEIHQGLETSKIIADMKKDIEASVTSSLTDKIVGQVVDRIIEQLDARKARAGLV